MTNLEFFYRLSTHEMRLGIFRYARAWTDPSYRRGEVLDAHVDIEGEVRRACRV